MVEPVYTRKKQILETLLLKWVSGSLDDLRARAEQVGSPVEIEKYTRITTEVRELQEKLQKAQTQTRKLKELGSAMREAPASAQKGILEEVFQLMTRDGEAGDAAAPESGPRPVDVDAEVASFKEMGAQLKAQYMAILHFHDARPRFPWHPRAGWADFNYYAFARTTVLAHLQASGASGWNTTSPYIWRLGFQGGNKEVRRHLLQFALEQPGQTCHFLVDPTPLLNHPLDNDPIVLEVPFVYAPASREQLLANPHVFTSRFYPTETLADKIPGIIQRVVELR